MISIKKGLNLPLRGVSQQKVDESRTTKTVAIVASNYVGMKPTMMVNVGDEVKIWAKQDSAPDTGVDTPLFTGILERLSYTGSGSNK
ncbi:MAG: hypothetical protein ACO2ZP_13650, partial [Bacteriovoracaceae bacterium]